MNESQSSPNSPFFNVSVLYDGNTWVLVPPFLFPFWLSTIFFVRIFFGQLIARWVDYGRGIFLLLFLQIPLLEKVFVSLDVCSGALSCWKMTASSPNLSHSGKRYWSSVSTYFSEFCFPSKKTSSDEPREEMAAQTITEPPPKFLIKNVFWGPLTSCQLLAQLFVAIWTIQIQFLFIWKNNRVPVHLRTHHLFCPV